MYFVCLIRSLAGFVPSEGCIDILLVGYIALVGIADREHQARLYFCKTKIVH